VAVELPGVEVAVALVPVAAELGVAVWVVAAVAGPAAAAARGEVLEQVVASRVAGPQAGPQVEPAGEAELQEQDVRRVGEETAVSLAIPISTIPTISHA
jgi:hypothetical protein